MDLESSTKAVEAVDGGRVACLGSSPVEVEYQGRITQTRLLVTDKLRNEVILSKMVLENLEVIDPDFPNAKIRSHGLQAPMPEKAKEVQGPMPESAKEVPGPTPKNLQGLVSHVIDSLHQAEVEKDGSGKAQ